MKFIRKISIIAAVVSLNVFMCSCSFATLGNVKISSKNDIKNTEKTSEISEIQQEEEHNAEEAEKIANAQQRAEEADLKIEKAQREMEAQLERAELIFGKGAEIQGDFITKDNVLLSYFGDDSKVVIPDGIIKIEQDSFWSIDSIEEVYIPSSVKEIGERAFWSCSGLKFFNADEGLETVGDTAFWSCPSLKDVNLPASVTNIGNCSFSNCDVLTIHASKGSYAEEYADSKKIPFDNNFTEFEENENENEKVIKANQYEYGDFSEFEIPKDITAIKAGAFRYCKSLKSIDIPSSVLSIGADAFEYCETLSSVNIPSSVEKIGGSAFDYCAKNLVIHTPKDSAAEKFAIENNIKFDNNI